MKLGFEAQMGFRKHRDVLRVSLRNAKGSPDVAVSSPC